MTAAQLKYNYELNNPEGFFFDRSSMKFFGDTMSNFGVRSSEFENWQGEIIQCWELYRRRPVKHGLQSSHYFDKATFKQVV